MMALGDAIAVTLMQMRGFTELDFARLHPGGSLGRRLWLRVSELMHKGSEIPLSAPGDKLDKVLLEMTQKCLGLTVVIDKGTIQGVVTDGDLRRYFQNNRFNPEATASDLMTKNPKRILSTGLALEARELMEKNSIHQLIIVDESDKLLGVLHIHDLMRKKVL